MIKKKYFVSYLYKNQDGGSGYGNCYVASRNKLNTEHRVKELQGDIENEIGFKSVVVMNWKRLKK